MLKLEKIHHSDFFSFLKKYFYFTLVFHKINTKFVALKCRVEIV